MAKRTYVANAPLVAQVDRIEITAEQYALGQIAEGSDLTATINDKTITATVPYIESPGPLDDANAVYGLLADLADKWNDSDIPEFQEVICGQPTKNDNGDWYVDLTARIPGIPFEVEIESTHPMIDVDTLRDGGPGKDEVQSFYLSPLPTEGKYRVRWDLGSGTESSGYVDFDANAAALGAAMAAGMPSLTPDNFTLSGGGVESDPFVVTLKGNLGNRNVPPIQVEVTALEGNAVVEVSTLRDGAGGQSDTVGIRTWGQVGGYPRLLVYTPLGAGEIGGMSNELAWQSNDTSETLTAKLESLPNVGAGNIEVTIPPPGSQSAGRMLGFRFKNALGGSASASIIPDATWGGGGGVVGGFVSQGGQASQPSCYMFGTSGTGGTFTITVNGETTAPIHYLAGYGIVHQAIAALPSFTGSEYMVVAEHNNNQNPLRVWGFFGFNGEEIEIDDSNVTGGEMWFTRITEGSTSTGVNERQSVWTNALGGTFTLTKPGGSTTAGLSPLASTDAIKTALQGIYGGTWTVTGSGNEFDPWICEAGGSLANTNIVQMSGNATNLRGASRGIVKTVVEGGGGVMERWSVAINGADGGTFVLSFRDHETIPIAYGASAATVEAALEALDNLAGVAVSGTGTLEDPYIVDIEDPKYTDTNLRQLIAWNEGLTGSAFPIVTHTTIQAAEGPWHWNLALNWWNADTNAYGIPQNGDDLYFEMGSDRRCPRYDLDQSALTVVGLSFLANFSDNATVGLPRWNPLGYWEYRETTLKIHLSGDGPITIGSRGGGGSSRRPD